MKFLSAALILGALVLLQVATERPNYGVSIVQRFNGGNFCWGQRTGNERLLYETRVIYRGNNIRWYMQRGLSTSYVRYGFIGKVTVDIDLPLNSRSIGGIISYIEGLNQGRCEGSVSITRGGLGFDSVTLHFEADYWKDIYFVIRVYGCYRRYC